MDPSMMNPQQLQSPANTKKAMLALFEALTSTCQCPACLVLREMAVDLKLQLK